MAGEDERGYHVVTSFDLRYITMAVFGQLYMTIDMRVCRATRRNPGSKAYTTLEVTYGHRTINRA